MCKNKRFKFIQIPNSTLSIASCFWTNMYIVKPTSFLGSPVPWEDKRQQWRQASQKAGHAAWGSIHGVAGGWWLMVGRLVGWLCCGLVPVGCGMNWFTYWSLAMFTTPRFDGILQSPQQASSSSNSYHIVHPRVIGSVGHSEQLDSASSIFDGYISQE